MYLLYELCAYSRIIPRYYTEVNRDDDSGVIDIYATSFHPATKRYIQALHKLKIERIDRVSYDVQSKEDDGPTDSDKDDDVVEISD